MNHESRRVCVCVNTRIYIRIPLKKWRQTFPAIISLEFVSLDYFSGQIIATSHDLTPNGGLVREIPLFQGNPGW